MHFQGMTTMIIAPLTTIKQQIEDDCRLYGISALVGDQVKFVCSMIFCSSVNHQTISVAYQMVVTTRSHSDPDQQFSWWTAKTASDLGCFSGISRFYWGSATMYKQKKPFNSNVKVRDVLLNVGLASSDDQRPVVCIDECQVPFEQTSPFKSFTIIVGPRFYLWLDRI